jgi:hypothetical protein
VIEAVGPQESMMQAIRSTRPGGHVGYVGISHDVALPGDELFFSGVHLHGGPAPVRRYLPELICTREIDPGRVFGPGGSPSGRPRQVGTCLPPAAQPRSAALSRAARRVRWSRSARLGAERAASA